jgi:CubicO group peptidase (beta-lactamase class C family)
MSRHRTSSRLSPFVLLPAAATLLGGCDSIDRAMAVPTHYASHQLCSAVFVGGIDPDAFYRDGIEREIEPVGGLISRHVDRDKAEVRTSFLGLVDSRAVYRGPLGCQVVHGNRPQETPIDVRAAAPRLLPEIAGPAAVEPADGALRAALDRAFAETPNGSQRRTKAIVIVHDGRVIAERYAPGYGVGTPLIGWSMTKSVTNALLGILVRQGKLSMDAPAPIAAWSNPQDPRHAITPDNLLRMNSGIAFGQSLTSDWTSAFDPSAQMEFDVPDMAAMAEKASLADPPGARWNYTNGNTLLLSRIIRDKVGGDAISVLRFAHRELFDKLGLEHATLEFDGAQTPIGSSHMWATARDWAKFGMLYLDDGMVGGERILPVGWADYSARLTTGSEEYGYGAGFWTNRGGDRNAIVAMRVKAGMPADSFMARGSQGQYAIIVPSARLVVVRLGMAYTPYGDIEAMERLVRDTLAALQHAS